MKTSALTSCLFWLLDVSPERILGVRCVSVMVIAANVLHNPVTLSTASPPHSPKVLFTFHNKRPAADLIG